MTLCATVRVVVFQVGAVSLTMLLPFFAKLLPSTSLFMLLVVYRVLFGFCLVGGEERRGEESRDRTGQEDRGERKERRGGEECRTVTGRTVDARGEETRAEERKNPRKCAVLLWPADLLKLFCNAQRLLKLCLKRVRNFAAAIPRLQRIPGS